MDALILLGAASGLPPLLPVGNGDQGVAGQPGDSLDVAIALAREAIDGVGPDTKARASSSTRATHSRADACETTASCRSR